MKIIILLCVLIFEFNTALACTLFAGNGDKIKDGGSIIVKNRDYAPSEQKFVLSSKGKYKFYGLYAKSGKKWSLKCGVNEKGLAVVSASASAIPKAERNIAKISVMPTLLSSCDSVEEALKQKHLFINPQFFMLADKNEIAYVEVGLNGYTINRKQNDTLGHTNHYLQSTENNKKISASSSTRYKRITELLNSKSKYTLKDFIKFSEDRNAGKRNSIWREGVSEKESQTLAVFAVHITKNGTLDIYLKMRKNPEDKGKEEIIKMHKNFE